MLTSTPQSHAAHALLTLCRRQTPGSLVGACKASLQRLGVDQVALYIQVSSSFVSSLLKVRSK